MKRGIIMEQHPDYTIIMTEDGEFFKAKRVTNREIGEEVYYEPYAENKKRSYFFSKTPVKMLALACVLLLVILPVYFFTNNQQTFAYVNIDINPSIELELDEQLNVFTIRPLNDDADILVKDLTNIKNTSIEEAIMMIMKECEEKGLLNAEKNMLIGVSYQPDTKSRHIAPVKERLNGIINKQSDWNVTSYNVPAQVREIATEQKESVNRVMANKILEKDEAIVKEFEQQNSEETNKKEFISSFYSNKIKYNRILPRHKKANNQNNKVSQDESEVHIQPKEEEKKTKDRPLDHPSQYKGPKDRSVHFNKKANDKIKDKERLSGEKKATTKNGKQSKDNPDVINKPKLDKKKYENPGKRQIKEKENKNSHQQLKNQKEADRNRGYKGKASQGEQKSGKHVHDEKNHINIDGNKKSQLQQHQDVREVHGNHKSKQHDENERNRGNKGRNTYKGSANKDKHKENGKEDH